MIAFIKDFTVDPLINSLPLRHRNIPYISRQEYTDLSRVIATRILQISRQRHRTIDLQVFVT